MGDVPLILAPDGFSRVANLGARGLRPLGERFMAQDGQVLRPKSLPVPDAQAHPGTLARPIRSRNVEAGSEMLLAAYQPCSMPASNTRGAPEITPGSQLSHPIAALPHRTHQTRSLNHSENQPAR